ncbi:MAG: hypothetical protein ACRBI6_04530 [Acidimicrobiales bacterium]
METKIDSIDEKVGRIQTDAARRDQAQVDLTRRVGVLETKPQRSSTTSDLDKAWTRKKIWFLGIAGSLLAALTVAVGAYTYSVKAPSPPAALASDQE